RGGRRHGRRRAARGRGGETSAEGGKMSILVDKTTRVIVQGLTGATGQFHAKACREYGTQVVGGVTPGKGGTVFEGFPIFDTVEQAVKETAADCSLIFV